MTKRSNPPRDDRPALSIPGAPGRGLFVGLAIVLLIATLAVYAQVRAHTFVEYDTGEYLTRNGWVQRKLSKESLGWALTSFHAANWHPLTWWSHMLDVELFGLQPAAYGLHLLHNVVLHAANTLLLFLLFVRWTRAAWRSAIVAGLFALHPAHAESVAWVVERKDVLSLFFGLLFLHAWTSWTRAPSVGKYALAWILLALGLAAKSMLITLPCALLLVDVWPLGRTDVPLRRRIVEKLPFVPLMAASAAVTSAAQHAWGAMSSVEHIGVGARVANALWAWPNYVVKLLWPANLVAFYPWRDRTGEVGEVMLWAALFAALCVAAIVVRKRAPWCFSGWFWFVGTLVPVIGLVQVGDQAMADRYTYLPSIGLFAALVWGASALLARAKLAPEFAGAIGVVIVSVCGYLGWKQIGYWKDTETMARRGLALDERNYKFHGMLGQTISERARNTLDRAEAQRLNEAALVEFHAALVGNPNSVLDLDRIGYLYMRIGRPAEAEPMLRRGLGVAPRQA
ncbi:MAG: hypothetical protein HZA53_02045, partial [Planctomycetes bacterium]|nr:hypothetical protein [Planctomycetota bacterium]